MVNLRARQTEALSRMLDLNRQSADPSANWQDPWKILVYDRACQDIISPLLRVGDLRQRGITLHLLIESERDAVPDVPAIYFVMPTAENVRLIGEDCSRRLYDTYHINFAAPVPRPLLEELADLTLRAEAVSQVSQVVDQYLGFISLEQDLVDLNMKSSFVRLNDPKASDTAIEGLLEQIVTSLFSVVATVGVLPIVRCPRGGAAQMAAELLVRRLREHLKSGAPFLGDAGSSAAYQRPVLIVLERSVDMGVMVQHPWSYRALCHELLGMRLNRLTCQDEAEEGAARQTHTYSLESADAFWHAQAGAPFPAVAEAVDGALQAYRAEVEAINSSGAKGGAGGGSDIDATLNQSTRQLQTAMSALPELQERKRKIDMHTNIATALLHRIRTGALDSFVGAEEAVLARTLAAPDKATVEGLLTGAEQGSAEDRLRLLCLYYLHCSPPDAELGRLSDALRSQGVDTRALAFLKTMAAFRTKVSTTRVDGVKGSGSGMMSSVFNLADKVGVGGSARSLTSTLAANVKQLLPARRETPTTKIVSAIMDQRQAPETDGFLTLDPKLMSDGPGADGGAARRGAFREAIVVTVGGGSYLEYQNLQDFAQQSGGQKSVVYVCTELLTGTEFLGQLAQLGPSQ